MAKRTKVLLIDDDKFLLGMYKMKYEEVGIDVVMWDNANDDIVQRVTDVKPDIIVMDIVMPGRDGYEALKLLKADSRTREIPVFIVCNLSDKEEIDKSLSLGAVDHLVLAYFTADEIIKPVLRYLRDPENYNQLAWIQERSQEKAEMGSLEDLSEKLRSLSERENSHYTDVMLKLETLLQRKEEIESDDELYDIARRFVIEAGKASTSFLQRKLGIGYARAARLIDMLEENGVIGEADGAKPRELLESDDTEDELYPDVQDAVMEAGEASPSALQEKFDIGYARACRLMDLLEAHGVIELSDRDTPRKVINA